MKEMNDSLGIVHPVIHQTSSHFVSRLVQILRSISSSIYLIAGNAMQNEFSPAHVYSVSYVRGTNPFSRISNFVYLQIKMSFRLARLSSKINIWFFFLGGETLLLPMLTAKFLRKKVVLVLGGNLEKEAEIEQDIIYKQLNHLKSINLRLANRIILYSPILIKEWNLEKHKQKILIAHPQFPDFERFPLGSLSKGKHNLIGYIGRFSEEKGVLNFVNAIPKVLSKQKGIKFLIVGDGKLRDSILDYLDNENLLKEVKFTKWVPHNEIPNYLKTLKLLVLPSLTEGLPSVMLEAMSCGTLVLATAVGSIPDIIRDGKTGFILENNSPDCIAHNIIRILNFPHLQKVIINARTLVENKYNSETAVAGYKNIILSLE